MPSKSMVPHTVTIFNSIGEIDGKEKYVKTILRNVQCDENFGVNQSLRGHNSDDTAALYIFDSNVKAQSVEGFEKSYITPAQWVKEFFKEPYWTLSENDYFILGESTAEDPRDIGAFKIDGIHRYNMGTHRMRHFEVYGR